MYHGQPAGRRTPPGRTQPARPVAGCTAIPDRQFAGCRTTPVRWRWLRTTGRVMLTMLSALVLLGSGIAWSVLGSLRTSDALGNGARSAGGALNILLIGLDSRKDQDGNQLPSQILDKLHAGDGTQGGYNTNTLILMHIPADGGKVTAVSIPRDNYVAVRGIPGYDHAKIKEAYGLAKYFAEQELRTQGVTDRVELEHRGREAGRAKTIETIRDFLDVPIDRFAEINLAGFYQLASALGGVEVCLKNPVRDSYSGANFRAGRQNLTGAQALAFVRQRHGLPEGDLDRTRRQQAFLASAMHKLRSAGTFTDVGKLRGLNETAKQNVVLSAGWDIMSFAQEAQNLTGGNMEFFTLPIEGYQTIDGQSVNQVDVEQVRAVVRTAFGIVPEPTTALPRVNSTLDVDNANGSPGLAATVAEALERRGFITGEVGNAPPRSDTRVTHGPGAGADAVTAATLLGGLPVVEDPGVPPGHVRVVLGADFELPAALGPNGAAGSAGAAPGAEEAAATPVSPAIQDDVDPATGAAPPDLSRIDGGGIPCVD